VTGCQSSSEEPVETLPETANITIDGVIDEDAYDILGSRKTGVKASTLVNHAVSVEGVYFGLTVMDSDHSVSPSSGIVASDYVGIAVDALATPKSEDGVSESTKLFRIDTMGRYTVTTGNEYGAWEDVGNGVYSEVIQGEGLPTVAFVVTEDVSYVVELFYSWELLGTTAAEAIERNHVMYYIEQRDMATDIHVDANILAPSMYNRLVYLGDRKGANLPELAPEITIDGELDDEMWTSALITNEGNFSERVAGETAGDYRSLAIWGENGIYLGVEVEDPDIEAPNGTGTAYKNAGMEMRMHVYNDDDLPLNTLKWLFDVWGPQWHETVSGGISSSYVPYAEYAYQINGTIDNDTDEDEGWSFEIYIPWEQLGISDPTTDYILILHAVGSHEQNNMLPQSYLDLHPDADWDNPLDYPRIEKPAE
jgi:hypothetical protein